MPTGNDLVQQFKCDSCGAMMGYKESTTYFIESGVHRHLCYFCRKFINDANVVSGKTWIVIYAINPEYSEFYQYPWI